MSRNTGVGRGKNPRSKANLAPQFDGSKAGPGRKPIPPEVKAERKEARQILKEAAPAMAARIAELAILSNDPDIAIKACKVGLDKVLPNLEEVDNKNANPYSGQHPSVLDAAKKLVEGAIAGASAPHTNGNGTSA